MTVDGVGGGAVASVSVTVSPTSRRRSSVPPWAITVPGGSGLSRFSVTTSNPASWTALMASGWAIPMTDGTVFCPEARTRVTSAPSSTVAPAAGSLLSTSPRAATGSSASLVPAKVRPAPTRASRASACDIPVSGGTTTCPGPTAMVSVTGVVTGTVVTVSDGGGSWAVTMPESASASGSSVTVMSVKPSPSRAATAAACCRPVTSGMRTASTPSSPVPPRNRNSRAAIAPRASRTRTM